MKVSRYSPLNLANDHLELVFPGSTRLLRAGTVLHDVPLHRTPLVSFFDIAPTHPASMSTPTPPCLASLVGSPLRQYNSPAS